MGEQNVSNKTRLYRTFMLGLSAAALFFVFSALQAQAAVRTWDGGGGDNNWSTAANWSDDTIPTSSDTALFDGTSTKNATIDGSFGGAVRGFDIDSGYTGTVTVSRSFTVGTDNFAQSDGTFDSGSQTVDINGTFTLDGGTFTATSDTMTVSEGFTISGGTFSETTGTVEFDGSSSATLDVNTTETFYNFSFTKSASDLTVAGSDTIVVSNDFVSNPSSVGLDVNGSAGAVMQVQGDMDITTSCGNIDLTFNGTGSQSITMNSGDEDECTGTVTVNKSAGTLTLASNFSLSSGDEDFNMTAGTFDTSSFILRVDDDFTQTGGTFNSNGSAPDLHDFILEGGTFNATTGTMTVARNWTHTVGGTFTHNDGTVKFDSINAAVFDVSSSETFYDVNFNKGSDLTISAGDTMLVSNDFISTATVSGADVIGATGALHIQRNMDITTSCGAIDITFNGSGAQSITMNSGDEGECTGTVTVNKGGGTLTLASDFSLSSGDEDFNLTAGTFDTSSYTLRVDDDFTQTGGTFNSNASSPSFYDFILEGGTFNASTGTMTVSRNWTHTVGGTFTHNSGTVTFDDSGAAVYNVDSSETFNNVNFNRGGDFTITTGDTMNITGNLVTNATAGGADFLTGAITLEGDLTVNTSYGSSPITLTGGNDQTITLNAIGEIDGIFTVNKSGGTATMASDMTLNAGTIDFVMTAGTFALSSYTLTVVDEFNQSGGTFNANSGTLDVNDDFIMSSGTFNAGTSTIKVFDDWTHTAGGTFNADTGTVEFDGTSTSTIDGNSSESFYNLRFTKSSGADLNTGSGDTIIVANDLYHNVANSNSNFDGTLVTIGGDATIIDSCGSIPMTFNGTGTQTVTLTNAVNDCNGDWRVNKSSGAVELATEVDLNEANQDLIIEEGTFDLSGNNLSVDGGSATLIVEDGGNLQLQGDETIAAVGGYPQLNTGSTVTYDATSGSRAIKDYSYENLTFNGSGGTFTQGTSEVLGGNLTVTAGTFDVSDQSLVVDGNTTIDGGTMQSGTDSVTFGDGAGDSVTISSGTLQVESDNPTSDITINAGTWTNSGGTIIYNAATIINQNIVSGMAPYFNLTINSSGSTYNLPGTIDINGQVDLSAGTLDATGADHDLTVGGGWTDAAGGVFTPRSGTVTFDGTGTVIEGGAFNDVAVNGGTVTLGAALDVDGGLTLTAGTLDVSGSNYGINVAGSWTDTGSGALTEQSGTVTFDGTGTINANESFNNVTIDSAGTATLGAALDVAGTVTLTAGTLDVSGSNYGISAAAWTDTGSGSFTEQSGTVTFDGTGTINSNEAFNDVTINTAGTATLGASLDVDDDLTITSGTLDASATNYNITVGGDWSNSGTFTERAATVTFDDAGQTSTVVGDTNFASLTSTTDSKAITFTAGSTQSVSNVLTLTGTSGNEITLRSSSDGSAWNLIVDGTSSVSFVDVKDSDASGGNEIVPTSSTDSGGNTNWNFGGSSGGSTSTYTPPTYTITLTTPEGDANYTTGDVIEITWSYTGTGSYTYATAYYSLDGESYTMLDEYIPTDNESYEWDTAGVEGDDVTVRIDVTDLVDVLDSDTCDPFTIASVDSEEEMIDEEEPVAEDSGELGISPVTGEIEAISVVEAGDLIKSPSFSTVYYISDDLERRPFIDATTYFTWADSFSDVIEVTDATLPTLTLGPPMLPQPGVVLVKIESDPKVYAVEASEDDNRATLRWIPDEDTAITLYGEDWADYVIDLPPTLFPRFDVGLDMSEDDEVDRTIMKTREEIASST